jgi:hypothetical protein
MEAKWTLLPVAGRGFGDKRLALALFIVSAGAALVLLGILVVARRLAGAAMRPAPAVLVLTVAGVVGMYSWLSRRAWREAGPPLAPALQRPILDAVIGWGPSLALVLLTLGLSMPFARVVDWLVWAPLWIADFRWRRSFFGTPPRHDARTSVAPSSTAAFKPHFVASKATGEVGETSGDCMLVQQLARYRDAEGRESISGVVCAEFAEGQRAADLYIGFCPPFFTTPTIDLDQSGGPPARIVAGQSLPHGARIEVRLNEPAAARGIVQVDVFATDQHGTKHAIEGPGRLDL